MGRLDFPTWYGVGSYGGLACCMLAAGAVAAYALLRHRGTPRQLARTVLVCLVAGCLSLVTIWWGQNRLDLYGPSLANGEVTFWLAWTALAGWFLPLGMLAGYVTLTGPQIPEGLAAAHGAPSDRHVSALDDPARRREPLGAGRPWGALVPLEGEDTAATIALTRELTLLGREYDNDIVIDDDRTSRHHAELRWEHGHVQLVDRGSMNGTLLNQQTVRRTAPLKSGDILELGAQRYRFELIAAPNATGADGETRKMRRATQMASAPPSPSLVLVALAGVPAGARWELAQDVTSIGRDEERQVCLPHDSVSRLHAQIVRQRSGYYVADLNSSNGTFVNEEPVTAPRPLRAGDVLRCGEIVLRCEPSVPQPEPASPLQLGPVESPVWPVLGTEEEAAPLARRRHDLAVQTPAPAPLLPHQPTVVIVPSGTNSDAAHDAP